jgi:hypothetical protein
VPRWRKKKEMKKKMRMNILSVCFVEAELRNEAMWNSQIVTACGRKTRKRPRMWSKDPQRKETVTSSAW